MLPLYVASLQSGRRAVHRTAVHLTAQPSEGPASGHNARLKLFDCDVNLNHESLRPSIEQLLTRAASQAHLAAAVVPGSDLRDSLEAIALAEDVELALRTGVQLYATAGVHPYSARGAVPESFGAQLRSFLNKKCVVAVGECGLDASPGFPSLDEQLAWFRCQLDAACEVKKPLFLHERGAFEPFMMELTKRRDRLPSNLLVHCFTGTEDELRTYLDFGCFVSISGLVCRSDKEGKRFQTVLKNVNPPAERLLIETDAPYMQFPGCRRLAIDNQWKERPNDPTAIVHVAQSLAKVLGRDFNILCRTSFESSKRFFSLD
jgi:TatD DNase family protein